VYLSIYDLSGIQGFIFQTNKMKEVIGASYLVSRALFDNIPQLLEEAADAWKTRTVDDLKGVDNSGGRIVYIGGGNALVLFGSSDVAKTITRKLQEKVFLQTGGALRVCQAGIEINDEAKRLSEYQKEYMIELDENKRVTPYVTTAPGFSVNELDNETFEPKLYFEDSVDNETKFLPRSRYVKLKEEKNEHPAAEGDGMNGDEYHNHLIDQFRGYRFKTEFKEFFREGDQDTDTGGKRFLAFVHIDGNTMGQKIVGFIDKLSEKEQGVFEDLISMRDLSKHISGAYSQALCKMVRDVFGEPGEMKYPFRPIIADGDDITFVCRSDQAFKCVSAFVEALNGADAPENPDLPKPEEFSVGVGVTFANQSYPFSTAYGLAEELCKNAKKKTIKRLKEGIIKPAVEPEDGSPSPVSSIDFHVCSGEIITDIKGFRKKFYERVDHTLAKRPYHMGITEKTARDLSFRHFQKERLGRLIEAVQKDWIARSKLQGLKSEYGKGRDFANRYGEFINSRDKVIQRIKEERRKDKDRDGESVEPAPDGFFEEFINPFDGEEKATARFFDALDVLDICTDEEVTQ
jgi:hypothetical protein